MLFRIQIHKVTFPKGTPIAADAEGEWRLCIDVCIGCYCNDHLFMLDERE